MEQYKQKHEFESLDIHVLRTLVYNIQLCFFLIINLHCMLAVWLIINENIYTAF